MPNDREPSQPHAIRSHPTSPLLAGPDALAAAIRRGLADHPDDRPDAAEFGRLVLRSCAAAPVRLLQPAIIAPTAEHIVDEPPPADEPAEPVVVSAARPSRRLVGPTPDWMPGWRRCATIPTVMVLALGGAGSLGHALGHVGHHDAVTLPSVAGDIPTLHPIALTPSSTRPAITSWREVVQQLADQRANALAAADAGRLSDVYAAGSADATADTATLRSLESRGLRVKGFTDHVIVATLDHQSAHSVTLHVTDRLSSYQLVDAAGRTQGQGSARARRSVKMTMTDVSGQWRIESIRPG